MFPTAALRGGFFAERVLTQRSRSASGTWLTPFAAAAPESPAILAANAATRVRRDTAAPRCQSRFFSRKCDLALNLLLQLRSCCIAPNLFPQTLNKDFQ